MPRGTQVFDAQTNELIIDMIKEDEKILLLEGGKGGLGNYHFKNSRNQAPTYAQPGLEGKKLNIRLELKLIANVGLVGFPNVGKSTLVSSISNARPLVANYEFTTLTPKLGAVEVGEYDSFVIADIPGIIKGASSGKGLGLEFLRHIQRTQIILYLIGLSNYKDIYTQYTILQNELKQYSSELFKRAYAIALSKSDALTQEKLEQKLKDFFKHLGIKPNKSTKYSFNQDYSYFVQDDEFGKVDFKLPYFISNISSASGENLQPLKYALSNLINSIKEDV